MNNHNKTLPNNDLLEVGKWMDEDKGYELSTHEKQAEFAKKRNATQTCPYDEWKPNRDIVEGFYDVGGLSLDEIKRRGRE